MTAISPAFGQEDGKAVLDSAMEGNKRYVAGEGTFQNLDQARRAETAEKGQPPNMTVIACSDSRVPVEMIFDKGIGDVFVIRVAGNVCQTDEIGSIEFGVEVLGTPLMIVLGHTHCGAVTAVVSRTELHGSIPALVRSIHPVAEHVNTELADKSLDERVSLAVKMNVFHQIEALLNGSPGVAEKAKEGKVLVVGAMYDIATGKVELLGEHPDQKELLEAMGHHKAGF